MNVDFLHDQIIRDTITVTFCASFTENLEPLLLEKYGDSLELVQFYENHIADGFRIGGVFYYPLTVVVSGVAKTEWISWQVANYRVYDNFNPFSYKGNDFLYFSLEENVPREVKEKMVGRPIYSPGNTLPVILTAKSDDKTFLAGKYSQGFIDLLSASLTEAIEKELSISGLATSGVVIEMNFAPGTFMEHIAENVTYRRLRIKARACAARDLWVKWTRLDGNGTYTVSDNVDRSMIEFALAEDVPGKIKEKEYRYLTAESVEKYQHSMSRKNITEWREMMRRVIRRGEVEKLDIIKTEKPLEPVVEPEEEKIEERVPVAEEKTEAFVRHVSVTPVVEVVSDSDSEEAPRERDEITERLNALLGKSDVEFSREPEALAESINTDLNDLLKGALGISEESAQDALEETEDDILTEEIPETDNEPESSEEDTVEAEEEEVSEKTEEEPEETEEEPEETEEEPEETEEEPEETEEEPGIENVYDALEALEAIDAAEKAEEEKAEEDSSVSAVTVSVNEGEVEARIRRELEEKMRAEMEELRKKNEEAEALKSRIEAQQRAEARERERLAEAARLAVLDSARREADRKAEEERDRIEAERKREEARAAEELRRKEEEIARAEAARIEADVKARREAAEAAKKKSSQITKTVNLIFRRGVVDKNMTKRVHEIIITTIKVLGKQDVYMRIKAAVPDPNTLTLTFSELPINEQQLIVNIIQVLGKSELGIIKATLE